MGKGLRGWVTVTGLAGLVMGSLGTGGRSWRVMPMGDSICMGWTRPESAFEGGWRAALARVTEVSQFEWVGPRDDFGRWAGGRGYSIFQLDRELESTMAHGPDLVLLMAGVNDLARGRTAYEARARMSALLEKMRPYGCRVILATLTPVAPSANMDGAARAHYDTLRSRVLAFNRTLPGLVADHRRRGLDIEFADLAYESGMTEADISDDGVHPLPSGYEKMARFWADRLNRVVRTHTRNLR